MDRKPQGEIGPTLAILERTPAVLHALLDGWPETELHHSHDSEAWTVVDVVAHLLHSELVNWWPRLQILMAHGPGRPFDLFDRFGHYELSRGKQSGELLAEFDQARQASLEKILGLNLSYEDLQREGRHPEFGAVTLAQLLSSWVVHDLNHLRQIFETLARQRTDLVGPWRAFLAILDA